MIRQEELEALVPSGDVRKFVQDTGYAFTDWQKAALLFHNEICLKEKFAYLEELMEHTADEKLKSQIADYLRSEDKKIRRFQENPKREFFYLLTHMDEDLEKKVYFFDYETAVQYGKEANVRFDIEKYPIVSGTMDAALLKDFQNGIYGKTAEMSYDESGEADYIWSTEPGGGRTDEESEQADYFGFAFYEVPNPFDRGDIVKHVGSGDYGIVEFPQKEWKACLKRHKEKKHFSDYSDVQIH